MTDKVRIGFAGAGNMGQAAHLRNYVTVPGCEVVALAEIRPKLREAVARKYGVARTYVSGAEMIAAEKLDGIVAPQPFTHHESIIVPLYKAGVPILTEKPLASSVEIAERMLLSLANSGIWHMVGYHKRSDPATMYAKAAIDGFKVSGELGKLKYVRITMPAGDWIANGFRDLVHTGEPSPPTAADSPAGDAKYIEFVNYYIHQINLLRHLLGEPYTVTYAEPSGVMLAAQSESGVPATIEMSPFTTSIDWQEAAFVGFARGWVKIDLPAPVALNRPGRVQVYRDAGTTPTPELITPTLPWNHAMYQQAVNFVAAIKGERPPMCTAEEALLDLVNARQYREFMAA